MSEPDLSGWLTKQQAAEVLRCSTKTVEAFAKDKKIQQGAWQPHGRGAAKAVYNPDDVHRLAKERRPGLAPFVLPAGSPSHVSGNGNGNGHHAPAGLAIAAGPQPSGEEILRLVFAAALRSLTGEPPHSSENSEKSRGLFLTIPEAATVANLPVSDIRRAIASGELKARKTGRGWRIRRKDLEAL